MFKRAILCVLLLGGILMPGMNSQARAATTAPALGAVASQLSDVTDVRWVCGPRRCAYIYGYRGPVVVRPYMRYWEPPPRPHCHYVRGPRGRWALVCP